MNTEEWITARPPTEEEVGDHEWCLVTCRGGIVLKWRAANARDCWQGPGPDDPIAWMPMPAPYQPSPQRPEAGELWEHRNGDNVFIVGSTYDGGVAYKWRNTHLIGVESLASFLITFTRLP